MTPSPRFLQHRPADLNSDAPWSQFRQVDRALVRVITQLLAATSAPGDAVVLDFGCAHRPYRSLLDPGWTYLGADIEGNPAADVTIRADGTLPLDDASVDVVLSTQVLEHVVDPSLYLSECRRVLRPGGSVVLTTHGIMYYHPDPGDYWRWTADGLTLTAERVGLQVDQVEGALGLLATSLQLVQDATFYKVPRLLRRPYAVVLQALIGLSDRPYSDASRRDNAMVLAVRASVPG